MKLDSHFVGTPLKPYQKTIHWRDTMNYAAAVDDPNDAYFDDLARGIIAPPMFPVAVTWPMIEGISEFIESAEFPFDLLATMVHYTESIQWHRPLIPGDQLSIAGKIDAIRPHRAGAHVVIRFDATDLNKSPIFTEHVGALLRGVECADSGRGIITRPENPEADVLDRHVWESRVYIDPLRPYIYDGCTQIVFPIHTSRKFARRVGLPGIILQGTATLAFAVREIVNREADAQPRRVRAFYARFTGMVRPGTEIRVVLTHKSIQPDDIRLFFSVFNASGEKAIKDGCLSLAHNHQMSGAYADAV